MVKGYKINNLHYPQPTGSVGGARGVTGHCVQCCGKGSGGEEYDFLYVSTRDAFESPAVLAYDSGN